ncbi:glucosamine-6-phosphate deaminase [Caryophanon latum]|uniref:Glucosamine-6-phosphate deaminase n=1 Tax=Caryophanon latum TaxID=33977 RepID=A0A1C0Z5H9_9BACL|nr:glucosamine-6-phosphate deaminase [Caryophanon latum]OCS94656.1 glucosamine-6-phosphate deaminase [Caryophanon latum]
MEIRYFENREELYKAASKHFEEAVANGARTFGLATGGTMEPLYENLRNSDVDFSQCTSFNLDEYAGIPKESEHSYYTYMHEQLFNTKPFSKSFVPVGDVEDLTAAAREYENMLKANERDIQLLGVGENGHIAFNEPGTSFDSETHVIELTPSTREANARYFASLDEVPTHAVTMGIASILHAKEIILIACGENKRDAMQALVEGDVTVEVPVSVLNNHPNVVIYTDLQLKVAVK